MRQRGPRRDALSETAGSTAIRLWLSLFAVTWMLGLGTAHALRGHAAGIGNLIDLFERCAALGSQTLAVGAALLLSHEMMESVRRGRRLLALTLVALAVIPTLGLLTAMRGPLLPPMVWLGPLAVAAMATVIAGATLRRSSCLLPAALVALNFAARFALLIEIPRVDLGFLFSTSALATAAGLACLPLFSVARARISPGASTSLGGLAVLENSSGLGAFVAASVSQTIDPTYALLLDSILTGNSSPFRLGLGALGLLAPLVPWFLRDSRSLALSLCAVAAVAPLAPLPLAAGTLGLLLLLKEMIVTEEPPTPQK